MSRKSTVQYQLNDLRGQTEPSEEDMRNILRAADEIIFVAGRTMLAKILKGSKDKKLLEKELDHCPSYSYYSQLSIEEITKIIDWMIVHNYLDINYNGRLPMIIFSEKGWETYKPFYVDELYNNILNVNEAICNDLIEQLKLTNREVVKLLLLKIGGSKNIGFIRFLNKWGLVEVKKVRYMINGAISKLKSV
ncbi:RQC domain protein [Clostridium homopropionicum DSM 5847]|uniref:RQC domain protein n=1 Tax=Clostridium homopropionicum DSM 5847 TaxID=1121318 RepID=A0A0L6Z706_9CLOT|nr:RQC-minor-1 family DNA-binding protein [Clostridium homopropionicum]KOA18734.1 RQC domain protein [Clostridium homopropionicum DSM 5847]SFG54280.1 RQC domain-containing protein [Clostridium homopropionicum]